MAIEINFPKEAQKNLVAGVRKAYNIIKSTIGPRGDNVIVESETINTGTDIINSISLSNPFQNIGVQLLNTLVNNIEVEVSDGTKAAIIIFSNLLFDIDRLINKGYSRIKLEEAINNLKNQLRVYFESIFEANTDPTILASIVSTATANPELKPLFERIFNESKNIGIVVEAQPTHEASFLLRRGISFDNGFLSLQMVRDVNKMETILKNPDIIVLDQNNDLPMVLNTYQRPLLLIMHEDDNESIGLINKNIADSNHEIVAITANRDDPRLEDLLVFANLKNVKGYLQGRATEVIITRNQTTIVNNCYNEAYLESLQAELLTSNSRNQLKLRRRMACLSEGIIHVTIPESENINRLNRAFAVASNASLYGVVLGEGLGYLQVGRFVNSQELNNYDEVVANILVNALNMPYRLILENGGINSNDFSVYDFNAQKFIDNEYFDIYDSLKVIESVIINSLNMLNTFIRYNILITN